MTPEERRFSDRTGVFVAFPLDALDPRKHYLVLLTDWLEDEGFQDYELVHPRSCVRTPDEYVLCGGMSHYGFDPTTGCEDDPDGVFFAHGRYECAVEYEFMNLGIEAIYGTSRPHTSEWLPAGTYEAWWEGGYDSYSQEWDSAIYLGEKIR